MSFNWGTGSRARMQGIHPILILFADRVLAYSEIDLTIPWMGGFRTAEQQRKIFLSGASRLNGCDKKSYHQTGMAIDIVIAGSTIEEMYNVHKLDYLNRISKIVWGEMVDEGLNVFGDYEYRMTFGCDWKSFKDRPHYQIKAI